MATQKEMYCLELRRHDGRRVTRWRSRWFKLEKRCCRMQSRQSVWQLVSQAMLKKLARYGVVGFEKPEQPHEEVRKESSADGQDMKVRSDGQHIQTLKTTPQRWHCPIRAACTSSICQSQILSRNTFRKRKVNTNTQNPLQYGTVSYFLSIPKHVCA